MLLRSPLQPLTRPLLSISLYTSLQIFCCQIPSFALSAEIEKETTQRPPLILGEGEQRFMHIPGLVKYSIGSPIVRILPLHTKSIPSHLLKQDTLLIKAIQVGWGDLWIWKKNGLTEHWMIHVEKWTHETRNQSFEKALNQLNETEVIWMDQWAILRGEISHFREASKISLLKKVFPTKIHDETHLSATFLETAFQRLTHWLNQSHYQSQLYLERTPHGIWIRGHLDHITDKAWIQTQVHSIFPLIQIDIETLPDHAPTIYFKVFLLEL